MKKRTYIDLSHIIEDGVITHKGLPAPIICDYLSREESRKLYEPGTEFQIGKIEMVTNTGTYIDVPFHRYKDGADLAQTAIDKTAGLEGIVVSVDPTLTAIDESHFQHIDVKGKAVLIHTGWDRYWNTDDYLENHPYLTESAAAYLVSQQPALVGIDSMNIDDTKGKARPAHTLLLWADIVIAEHLCHLDQLTAKSFLFYAVPPKIKGVGTFPVRAFAEVERK